VLGEFDDDDDDEEEEGEEGESEEDDSDDGGLFPEDNKKKGSDAKSAGKAKKGKKARFSSESEDDGAAHDDDDARDSSSAAAVSDKTSLTALSLRTQKLQDEIRMLEETAMGDKPWQLTGEVSAGKRPHNSLLSASLDFESATMPSVEPTQVRARAGFGVHSVQFADVCDSSFQALVEEIEAMIKKRIADGVYDDVIR
jgi:U3 small nucleolar RNA-associated protein MPP10